MLSRRVPGLLRVEGGHFFSLRFTISYTVESSTYVYSGRVNSRSLIISQKASNPIRAPCGIAPSILFGNDIISLIFTNCCRLSRNPAIHLSNRGWISICLYFLSSIWWLILLNAFV